MREGLLHFYAFVDPKDHGVGRNSTRALSFYTFNEAELEKDFDIEKFRKADVFAADNLGREEDFPPLGGALAYCHVNRSLIHSGGCFFDVCKDDWTASKHVWSLDVAAAAATRLPGRSSLTWRICADMHRRRQTLLAVPYDGRIFMFGGDTSSEPPTLRFRKKEPPTLEIYDPKSRKLSEPKPLHKDLSHKVDATPKSYFLWKDSLAPHKKPLIMMRYEHRVPPCQRLWSYDVEEGSLEVFDTDFPVSGGVLLPLDGSSTLLIISEASEWSVYDMSSKKVTGQVFVPGLEGRGVWHAFCRHCSDASVIVYLFMEESHPTFNNFWQLPCAKVRLRMDGGKFSAALESEVTLQIGQHWAVHMRAPSSNLHIQMIMREAVVGAYQIFHFHL